MGDSFWDYSWIQDFKAEKYWVTLFKIASLIYDK